VAAPTAAARRAPLRRPVAPRVPRRVSGPSRGRAQVAPRPTLGARALGFVVTLPDHRLVDRLVRGRVWIPLIGFLLIGIVAMQVSMLKLNAGIGSAVQKSSTLERTNGELRADLAKLGSGERIQQAAGKLGMVMPAPDQVRYLTVGRAGH
jgi:cell division protein FtsL